MSRLKLKPSPENTPTQADIPARTRPGAKYPECPLGACDGSGWIYDAEHDYVRACACREIQRIQRLFEDAKIPLRYRSASLDDLRLAPTSPIVQAAREFAENASPGHEPCAFVLTGPVGTGKTHLAYAMVNAMIQRGMAALAESVPDLIEALRVNQLDELGAERLRVAKTVPVLLLDDLAAHRQSEFAMERLFMVVNARYNEMLPTIVTANLSLDQVLRRTDPMTALAWDRLFSRLKEMAGGQVWRLEGQDRRLAAKGAR